MRDYYCKMEADKFYHVYNRGNNKENLFYKTENYEFFLRRYDEYFSAFLNMYSFCLLRNHFHLLVQVKSDEEVQFGFEQLKAKSSERVSFLIGEVKPFEKVSPLKTYTTPEIISKRFHDFFTSYSIAINKQQKRSGSLFLKPFKRVHVDSNRYFSVLLFYIHANPQIHGIYDDIRKYPWSSYIGIISNKPTKLKRKEILEWFTDKENYIAYHAAKANLDDIRDLLLDE